MKLYRHLSLNCFFCFFLYYLWGIETCSKVDLFPLQDHPFLYYLWGIETEYAIVDDDGVIVFLYYLWGIETRFLMIMIFLIYLLFILPMRNWNKDVIIYKTLEAGELFILPMRNWNWQSLSNIVHLFSFFLYYLWGIETYLQHITCGWECKLFILPMRNWNFPAQKKVGLDLAWTFYITYEELKHTIAPYNKQRKSGFLYYLWGIETYEFTDCKNDIEAFYITYEELKQM